MKNNTSWTGIIVLLHTKYDLPDSGIFNGKNFIVISNSISELHKIEIRKKYSIRESTRRVPCVFYEKKTCQSIEDNMLILSKFKCQIPILYHGHHLDDLIPKDVTKCSNEKTKGIYNRSAQIIHPDGC